MQSLSRSKPIAGRGYDAAYQAFGPVACNAYTLICNVTNEAAIVDPSTYESSEFAVLQDHLKGKEVKHILLTHGHVDHVSGLADAAKQWPNAKIHLHSLEQENYEMARERGKSFGMELPELPSPTDEIVDGSILKIGDTIELKCLHTPGHAPGHVVFADDRTENGDVTIGGDLLFNGSVGRTDFFNSSMEDLLASLRRLYEELDDMSIVLSGHTTPTYLNKEREVNPFVAHALSSSGEWYEEAKDRHGWK
ncbi:MAG: hypothetical protein SGBAC_005413 [Bacillariaceae sp.]